MDAGKFQKRFRADQRCVAGQHNRIFHTPSERAPSHQHGVARPSLWLLHDGLYAKRLGSGQVNTVTGDFVFAVTEGYLIENGRITRPVRGATIIGNGPAALRKVDMVADDVGLAPGTCGKEGQAVPVSVGQPHLRISELTVGGTRVAGVQM